MPRGQWRGCFGKEEMDGSAEGGVGEAEVIMVDIEGVVYVPVPGRLRGAIEGGGKRSSL
jgi:hypothetical protein